MISFGFVIDQSYNEMGNLPISLSSLIQLQTLSAVKVGTAANGSGRKLLVE